MTLPRTTGMTAVDAADAFPSDGDVHYWRASPPYTAAIGYTRAHVPLVRVTDLGAAVAKHAPRVAGERPIFVRRPRIGWWSLHVDAEGTLTLERLDGRPSAAPDTPLIA